MLLGLVVGILGQEGVDWIAALEVQLGMSTQSLSLLVEGLRLKRNRGVLTLDGLLDHLATYYTPPHDIHLAIHDLLEGLHLGQLFVREHLHCGLPYVFRVVHDETRLGSVGWRVHLVWFRAYGE